MYKISVIIPMFKARDYIDCCLASLGRQGLTEEELEVLFIDDCSPDNTYEYAREAASGRANIRVLKQEKNGGPGRARNRGIDEATGEYICFLDIDDMYVEGSFKEMYEAACSVEADVYYSNLMYMTVAAKNPVDLQELTDDELLKMGLWGGEVPMDIEDTEIHLAGDIRERMDLWLKKYYNWSSAGKLFKRSFLREHRLEFPEMKIGEDQFFILNCLIRARVYASQLKCFYIYRVGDGNSVSRGRANPNVFINSMDAIFKSLNMIDDIIPDTSLFNEQGYREKLKAFQISIIENSYALPTYKVIGREALTDNAEVEKVFEEYFKGMSHFVRDRLFDAYDSREAGMSFSDITSYENLKKLKMAAGNGIFGFTAKRES